MKIIHNRFDLRERRRELRRRSTPQEIVLWSRLRNRQLGYKFRRQHSIGFYIADFYCSEKKLVIELDGKIHDENRDYDIERDFTLQDLGFHVLRIPNESIDSSIDKVISKIENILM